MQFTFDPIAFLTDGYKIAGGVIFLVIALTYASEKFGAKGKVQLAIAMILGLILGAGVQLASFTPKSFADWFFVLVYAGIMSVTPSLLYEQAKEVIIQIVSKAFGKIEPPR